MKKNSLATKRLSCLALGAIMFLVLTAPVMDYGSNDTVSTALVFSDTGETYLEEQDISTTNQDWPQDPAVSLEGRIIVLDAGHGYGNSPGFAGYEEHASMLTLSHYIKPLLEARGATVVLTRPTTADVSLPVRVATINHLSLEVLREARLEYNPAYNTHEIDRLIGIMQNIIRNYELYAPIYFNFPFDDTHTRVIHPDLERIFELQTDPVVRDVFLVISLHSNATPRPIDTTIHGADAYVITLEMARSRNYFLYYSNERRSRYFSSILLNNIHRLGIRRRGISGGNWFMIREHNLPGALVENGFHTNDHDRALLLCNEFLQRLAVAYEDAIVGYFVGMR